MNFSEPTDVPSALYAEKQREYVKQHLQEYREWWKSEYERLLNEVQNERKMFDESIKIEGFEVKTITGTDAETLAENPTPKNSQEDS